MFPTILLVTPILLNVAMALPVNHTQGDIEDITSIVNYYIENSAMHNPQEDPNVLKWAETVHACRKSTGITTRIGSNMASTEDKRAKDYTSEKNTETEKDIPTWELSPSDFDEFFDKARFDRFLTYVNDPSFKRRLTWLFPDNGCWVRAELYIDLIEKFLQEKYPDQSFTPPKKHFAFGDLYAKSTSAHPQANGIVSWSWHVAPIVRLNDGKLYVMDPALSADAVEKEDWYALMSQSDQANISGFVTCDSNTYGQFNMCFNPTKNSDEETNCEIQGYLTSEWIRQQDLGRDPNKVLGDDTQYYLQG